MCVSEVYLTNMHHLPCELIIPSALWVKHAHLYSYRKSIYKFYKFCIIQNQWYSHNSVRAKLNGKFNKLMLCVAEYILVQILFFSLSSN